MSQKRELLVIESRPISVRTRGHLASNNVRSGSLLWEKADQGASSFSPTNDDPVKRLSLLEPDALQPPEDQQIELLEIFENQKRREAVASTAKASSIGVFYGLRPGMGRNPAELDNNGRCESQGTLELSTRREEVCHAFRLS